ncbi:NAD(P)-dependent oxidoreductase [Inquilinus sp. Marseille-Q2685]|uniref:NAD-dependent epimerase/dehydratase family protein n=1 Tax=Inquilinus sp. Marseille-Q2685 TaxID=2866581 RepID=UPI001CE40108|nr:NAD-dependent epimerase/dehydratase family protein [Inquilinus sp. Marseille-Q2685]
MTGVAGFLGSHLADAFLSRGEQVAGIDNLLGGAVENVPPGVNFRMVDCNDRHAYADMLHGTRVAYHCAALAHEGLSVFSPHLISTHGVNATTGFISAAIAAGVKRIVYCSSMARYGRNPPPFTEDQDPRPVDPYAVSKCAGELMLRTLCDAHGVEFNIAVPHNIIGPRQRYDDPYRNVASIMINRMLRGLQPVIYGDGAQRRCFSFVDDVVPSLVRLGVDPDIRSEVFNLGPDEQVVSILDLAREIADLLDFELAPIFVPSRPLEVQHAFCSSDKARRLLGYRTTYRLRDGLAKIIAWIRAKGPKEFRYDYEIEIRNERTPRTWAESII